MTYEELRSSMHARAYEREKYMREIFSKLHRKIDEGRIGGEEGRIWLEQFCVGQGVQVCCGDFSIGDSLGIDQDLRMLATDLLAYGDRIPEALAPLDYIVTNYFECFPDPLRVLGQWASVLRPEGILGIVCRDSESYEEQAGPLTNRNRQSCFTITTLRCYLARAGFEVIQWEGLGKELRVAARRR